MLTLGRLPVGPDSGNAGRRSSTKLLKVDPLNFRPRLDGFATTLLPEYVAMAVGPGKASVPTPDQAERWVGARLASRLDGDRGGYYIPRQFGAILTQYPLEHRSVRPFIVGQEVQLYARVVKRSRIV